MRKNLIDKKQPFGEVNNYVTGHYDATPSSIDHKSLGATTERQNIGKTVVESFADKCVRPSAPNGFKYTGHPKEGKL